MLASGKTLAHFTILNPIGAGGMGEVYRARDQNLGRDVALKLLPDAFAQDPDRISRIEREARALAALNHPGIAVIHGLEEEEGSRFLVLELVEGEPLDHLLARGRPPLQESLRIGIQMAEALAAAHAKGILHRDLKPANIMVTPSGRVKVLDFGLAKALAQEAGAPAGATQAALTLASGSGTAMGAFLGTPDYMSPEQMRGGTVGPAADVWSLGCVLYELLSGARAFPGKTLSDSIAAVLGREPDWSLLPSAPATLSSLVKRCLEKDPARRPSGPAEVASRLEEALSETRRQVEVHERRAHPKLTQATFADEVEAFPAWSPDGKQLLYAREAGSGRKIFLKNLTDGSERQLTRGERDDILPGFSPDGLRVLFTRAMKPKVRLEPGDVFGPFQETDIWSVDFPSGKAELLVANACNAVLSPDGKHIAVDAEWAGPRRIWIVERNGRNPVQVTTDSSEAVDHIRPRWSPDGSMLVFQNVERTKFDIRVVRLRSRELVWITNDLFTDVHPFWSPSGRFIYFSSFYRSGAVNIWRIPVGANGIPEGTPYQVTTGAGQDIEVAISPDGSRMAFTTLRQNADLWRLPVSPETGLPTGAPEKVIATSREDSRGAWSPDGHLIAFNSDRGGDMNIWLASLEDGTTRPLTRGPGGDFQPTWSPDARRIAFFSTREGNPAIWTVEVGSGAIRRLSQPGGIEINPFYSPDGRRVAYQSDRSGRLELWVMNADGTEPRQLTHVGVGGHFMRWNREGNGILCVRLGHPGEILIVPVEGSEEVQSLSVKGGSHISLSPDHSRIMDVVAHKTLWTSPLQGGEPARVFEFDDPDVRIDYPVWSPDGRWVLFDRFRPQGGDIWVMEGFE